MSPVPLLIYDGQCPMCVRARQWVEARVPAGSIEFLACQDPRRAERAPAVSESQCMEAMQFVGPDGRVYSGERAFPPLLRLTRYGRWIAWCFQLPGTALVYRAIARNRQHLSAFFKPRKPGEHCSIDDGCD